MTSYAKPLPQPDPVTLPFWEGLKAHTLRLQRCAACSTFVFYPRAVCPHCFSASLEWIEASGRGTLHTFTIVHRAPTPEFRGDVPYVVALVDLEEGVRMMASLLDVTPEPDAIQIGMPLEIVYDDVTPEVTLPRFRPATSA
jgi:uncharacterized protein